MKELDGKGCLYEKSAYVCGILKIKDCNKCKFKISNTEENYQKGENINDNYSFSELIQTTDYYIQIGDEIDYDENWI